MSEEFTTFRGQHSIYGQLSKCQIIFLNMKLNSASITFPKNATFALHSCTGKLWLFSQISVLQVSQDRYHVSLQISSVMFSTPFLAYNSHSSPHSNYHRLDIWIRKSSCLDQRFNMTKNEENHSHSPQTNPSP